MKDFKLVGAELDLLSDSVAGLNSYDTAGARDKISKAKARLKEAFELLAFRFEEKQRGPGLFDR